MSDILDTMKSLTDDPDTKVRLVRLADIYEVDDEIERLRSDNARMREALLNTGLKADFHCQRS